MSVDMIGLAGAAFVVPILAITIGLGIWVYRQSGKKHGEK